MIARRESTEEDEVGARASMPGWDCAGEELKAESSVRIRLVGVRADEEEDVVDMLDVVLFVVIDRIEAVRDLLPLDSRGWGRLKAI